MINFEELTKIKLASTIEFITKIKLSLIIILFDLSFSQSVPNHFFAFKKNKIMAEAGLQWNLNTSLGYLRFQNLIKKNNDKDFLKTRYGLISKNHDFAYYGFGLLSISNSLYCYTFSRVVSNPNSFDRFTGLVQKKSRFGFNSGESDLAGIGYDNGRTIFQIGRGRESWGAGEDIEIALNKNSPAYDYFLFGIMLDKIKLLSINGFLESNSAGVNRYLSGRGIEFNNKKNFLISLSEIVVYSGINRPLDMAYLNPVSSHLEIELNDRQNKLGTSSGNAVWQISIDSRPKKKTRFSFNFLFDELILDKIQKSQGKESMFAYSSKLTQNIISDSKHILNVGISNIFVGAQTFKHEDGNNNFVQRGFPLGWKYGSNGKEYKVQIDYLNFDNLIFNLDFGLLVLGSESILDNPYEPYKYYNSFGVGLEKKYFFHGRLQWWPKKNISIYLDSNIINSTNDIKEIKTVFGIDIYKPFSF